ncbi:MAG: type IX secretion system membrane protein PorP/SprF [Sphingobacteriia bacterium]|nr:type IX secretion system membrane protein PorP/SprF [Sphingobacteriia bacterium]
MTRKFIPIIFFFTLAGMLLKAQQLPQYSQYMFNRIAYNPGYAGTTNGICVGGLIRQQWVGFEETNAEGTSFNVAPETYVVSINSPVKVLRGGLAGTIIQDKIGYQKDITVNLIYAYQTMLGAGDLGIGLQLSLINKTIDFNKLEPPGDKGNDPVLQNKAEESDIYIDGGLGLYYSVPDNYYLGLSVLQMRQAKKNDGTGMQLKRQINVIGGYEFTFPNTPSLDVLPSVMIKTDGTSSQYDFTALLRYNNKVWGGLSYRYQDSPVIILGMQYRDFNIGYSYDIPTSSIGSQGSHEVRVGYCFKIEIDKFKKIYRNTRFL